MKVKLNPTLTVGTELDIVNAARCLFDTSSGDMTERDEKLVKFLIKEKHWLPFRHPQLSFSCDAPIYVARQLGKHQVGLTWSEDSRRYVASDIRFYTPETIRHDVPGERKQGKGPDMAFLASEEVKSLIRDHQQRSLILYDLLIAGAAPEQARGVLPQDMIVTWTWTGSLLAFLHLIRQRLSEDAQEETKILVRMIAEEVKIRFPITAEALEIQGLIDK